MDNMIFPALESLSLTPCPCGRPLYIGFGTTGSVPRKLGVTLWPTIYPWFLVAFLPPNTCHICCSSCLILVLGNCLQRIVFQRTPHRSTTLHAKQKWNVLALSLRVQWQILSQLPTKTNASYRKLMLHKGTPSIWGCPLVFSDVPTCSNHVSGYPNSWFPFMAQNSLKKGQLGHHLVMIGSMQCLFFLPTI